MIIWGIIPRNSYAQLHLFQGTTTGFPWRSAAGLAAIRRIVQAQVQVLQKRPADVKGFVSLVQTLQQMICRLPFYLESMRKVCRRVVRLFVLERCPELRGANYVMLEFELLYSRLCSQQLVAEKGGWGATGAIWSIVKNIQSAKP